MSLSSHIREGKKSPIGQFLCERFSQTSNIVREPNRQLRSATTIRPEDQFPPYMTLGMAIDYRIRYSLAITPNRELIAWRGAWNLVLKVKESKKDKAVPIGKALDIIFKYRIDNPFLPVDRAAQVPYSPKLIKSFFHDLNVTLAEIRPTARRLEAHEEQLLARYCYVLALFDVIGRTIGIGLSSEGYVGPLFEPTPKNSVQDLLAIPQDEWIDDLCAMSWLFYDKQHNLLPQPAVLNPTFAGSGDIGGADADMIINGCIIDLKASVKPEITAIMLRQITGYLLLDYNNIYQINAVGIYMLRQGLLFTWPVEEFLQTLTGDPLASVIVLREEFRALLGREAKPTIVDPQVSTL